ncbi:hypothetical protein [Methylovulum miyakonense]|uniref:hypothetical protein n=1 Tax=Methylovulum miyakonense TaxID=645578 RepID=UPI0003824E6F|nr:hypothetical protein [Methylovulum miyakonense]
MSDHNTFLGNMQTTVVGNVICITKYEIDANSKGGSIWVSKPNTGRNPNIIGDELIKIRIPFEMFEQQRQKLEAKEITLPGVFEILADIDMGGQNKAALTALSIKPYKPGLPTADDLAAKPNGDKPTDGKPPATTTGNQTVTQRPTA